MAKEQYYLTPSSGLLFFRYLKTVSDYWRGRTGAKAWGLFSLLIVLILLQLFVQYLLNFWNRDFFNGLTDKDIPKIWTLVELFVPLAVFSIIFAVLSVWGKMTLQRSWREWLSKHLIHYWLKDNHYQRLRIKDVNQQLNAEYRIAEDARVATDLPIDLVLGFFTSVLTALTFISILWEVGGTLNLSLWGYSLSIPGYLVVSAILYSALLTGSMMLIGNHLTESVEEKNHTEAELRATASKLRSHGEGRIHLESEKEEAKAIEPILDRVIASWKDLCWQLMRTTVIAHGNGLIAPIIGLLLCAPQYLAGEISLGQVVQASAAFVTVQHCFNWVMDNYPRIADWLSSANRVGLLLLALDELEEAQSNKGQ